MASRQDSTLLSLPAELRNGIYEEVAYDVKNITIKIKDSTSDFVSAVLTNHPIVLVCRQFHSEASQLVKATMLITSTHYTILTTNLP